MQTISSLSEVSTEIMANSQPSLINVMDFGAVGDGTHDDTAAIQQAIEFASAEGKSTVFLPAGRFKTTSSLRLPAIQRPNTKGTQGAGFILMGAGMYDSGLIYTGTDYAIVSNEELAEAILFQDFYINHATGGGIRLPQGAHQWFDRFFSSACALGKYGVLIEGNRAAGDPEAGYGSYMISFTQCRFWSEMGYNGTGVRLQDVVLCTLFNNCFFSRAVQNVPHLELVNCHSVHINSSAFERSEQTVSLPPEVINNPDLTDEEKERILQSMAREANQKITESLIKLDNSHSISILECHAEMAYPSFVGITNHSSHVLIDGCRLNHYAISDYNEQKGYVVTVHPESWASSQIILGRRNQHMQANHPNTTHGEIVSDPHHCVTILDFQDVTPFSDAFYLTERRTVSRMGTNGFNLLINPGLYSDNVQGIPLAVEAPSGQWGFKQLAPSGCLIVQSALPPDIPYVLKMHTSEPLNKYEIYTFFLIARNLTGKNVTMWLDIGGDGNDSPLHIPSGEQRFTLTVRVKSQDTSEVRLVVYGPIQLEVYSVYLVPNSSSEVPYGSEIVTASKLNLGAEIRYGTFKPEQGGYPGDLVINQRPSEGSEIGWVCIAPDQWMSIGNSQYQQVRAVSQLPTPEESLRGMMVRLERTGLPDFVYICKKLADNTYRWILLG